MFDNIALLRILARSALLRQGEEGVDFASARLGTGWKVCLPVY